jgi:MoxR-like ATPase
MELQNLKAQLSKSIIGQQDMIDSLLIGLLCDGHILLEGVPGLAKTTAVKALASALDLQFKRVQFTPDLLPSDILGAQIYNQKTNEFSIRKGPIFTNLLLADEINRAPAKAQSALLEVMQERHVTIADETFAVPSPFLVLATQNPIEQIGAYSLPEAQLDRFMLKILVGYNTKDQELQIAKSQNQNNNNVQKVLGADGLIQIKSKINKVHIDEEVEKYMIELVFATRNPIDYKLDNIAKYISFGVSPRASIDLFKASKARAFLNGVDFVSPDDIAQIVKSVFRHRMILSYEAQANEISSDNVIDEILNVVPIP